MPDYMKHDDEILRQVIRQVNVETGATNIKGLNQVASSLAFAPKLAASRWEKMYMDPLKSLYTLSKLAIDPQGTVTPAERLHLKQTAIRAGEITGTLMLGLAANAGLQSLMGSKNQVNFTNPMERDFLKFKVGDREFDISGGMLPEFHFISKMLYTPLWASKQELMGKSRAAKVGEYGMNYLRGKLQPVVGTLADFAFREDVVGNTLPPFDRRSEGKYRMSWSEYLLKEGAPIPVSEAIGSVEERMKAKGLHEADITDILTNISLFDFGIATTGIRMNESKNEKGASEVSSPSKRVDRPIRDF